MIKSKSVLYLCGQIVAHRQFERFVVDSVEGLAHLFFYHLVLPFSRFTHRFPATHPTLASAVRMLCAAPLLPGAAQQ